ncbi:hypothetical protein LBMAG57_37540 [Verrucomicrobiota bacterium]|nr:hypothetical protein LBMAG57_37540 [Verrucomicrobiota bacterium]
MRRARKQLQPNKTGLAIIVGGSTSASISLKPNLTYGNPPLAAVQRTLCSPTLSEF